MPNGEFSPSSRVLRWSATPSPSLSRSNVMRLALGVSAPARFITRPVIQARRPPLSFGGALLSATSTSPLGSRCSQRGWSSWPAKAATASPGAGVGFSPAAQGWAGAMLTVGNRRLSGSGSCGCGPVPAETGRRAVSLQPARTSASAQSRGAEAVRGDVFMAGSGPAGAARAAASGKWQVACLSERRQPARSGCGRRGRGDRQGHREGRAGAERAFDLDRAAVRLDKVLGDVQAQAHARCQQAVADAHELVEDALLVLLGDADAAVADLQHRLIVLAAQLDLDRPALAVADRVAEQVDQHLLEPERIPVADDVGGGFGRGGA